MLVWQDNPASSRPTREIFLAVRETAPFGLQFDQDKLTVEAGEKVDAKLLLKRQWPDFTGSMSLQIFAFLGRIKANLPQFAAGVNDASITFEVQANTLVTLPCRPITISVTAAAK